MKALRPDDPAVLQAMADTMAAVVTDWGTREPAAIEVDSFDAIARFILRRDLDLGRSNPVPDARVASAMEPDARLFTLRLCMALFMSPGFVDVERFARLEKLARILNVRADAEFKMMRWALEKRYKRLVIEITRHAASE